MMAILAVAGSAIAQPYEPVPNPDLRALRSNYIRDWYIYSDDNNNGILDPGDSNAASLKNWWTPVSSGSQANMWDSAGGHTSVAPMNFARTGPTAVATDNYWLDRGENSVGFYMTYAQEDNNDALSFSQYTIGGDPSLGQVMAERYGQRDGWAMGWVVNDLGTVTGQVGGTVAMDIYVHNGRFDDYIAGEGNQPWVSNPQVTQSDDQSSLARDHYNNTFQTIEFDELVKAYTAAANTARMNWDGLTAADIQTIANSMDVRERDPMSALINAIAIHADKTPSEVAAVLTDDAGNPYLYQDAFTHRGEYMEGETDGGVIGGLGSYGPKDSWDPNAWGDQQVVRIDVSDEMLATVDELVFYDFADQLNPTAIIFGVDTTQSVAHGQVYLDGNGNGIWDQGELWFPDNRIYIGQMAEMVPEPGTLALLASGAAGMLLRRKRRNA
jgi:hypothetical protein